MKTDYTSNLRYNEKIKETQTFMTVDGLMKKIRKKYYHKEEEYVDAEMKLRQIMCFWKQNWEYEHFHPIFLNPSVHYPIVLMDSQNNTSNKQMKQFIEFVRQFIQRMRIGQQNQINYKIQQMQYQRHFSSQKQEEFKLISTSSKSIESSLRIMYEVTKSMVRDLKQSNQKIQTTQEYLEKIEGQDIKYSQNSQIQLKFIMLTLQQHYETQFGKIQKQMMDQGDQKFERIEVKQDYKKDYKLQTEELIIFSANVMKILQKMKIEERHYGQQKKYGSSFISVQPQIGELTYILHPLLFAINGHFIKQKIQKQFDKIQYNNRYAENKQKQKEEKKCEKWFNAKIDQKYLTNIKDNMKCEEEKHSKIVFLNLDGYQSQYNIEFAKNFSKYLMYISFPNFGQSHRESHACRQKRFYKKIMFNQTQRSNETFSNQILQQMAELQYLCQNPQNYHQNAEKFYQPKAEFYDNTENIFIFPMQMQVLAQKHRQQATKDKSVESYQSFFIRYMMKNHMNHFIRSFNPSHIVISYSNSINIEEPHFIEMMQELTKISKYKLMLFPNFTTSYVSEIQLKVQAIDQKDETDYEYSYAVSNSRLLLPAQQQFHNQNQRCFDNCCYTLAFLNKLAVFLKVSSGTYNLQNVYQRETPLSKYKNVKIFPHVQFLFEVLGKQYTKIKDKVDKTMLNATSAIITKAKEQCQQNLDKCVSKFYKQLFKVLQSLIFINEDKKKKLIHLSRQIRDQYQNEIIKIKEQHQKESISTLFQEFLDCERMQKADNKYHQNTHIYIKTRQEKIEYRQIQNQNEQMRNVNGIHRVMFSLKKKNKQSQLLRIYKDTSVVYQSRQIGKKQCFVLLMNHLSKQQEEVGHYIGKIPIAYKVFKQQIQKCVVLPIQFNGGDSGNHFKVKCEWNYAQTTHNLILYWPSEYDFIRASLFKFNQQKYEPKILNQIYVANVNSYNKFYKVRDNNQNIIPRKGCSYYNLENRIFIFGGSYERQFNYLNLQHDITLMELQQTKQLSEQSLIKLFNLKENLYSTLLNSQTIPNSLVRTKFQMQFFELQQLRDLKESQNIQLEQNRIKTVIMFGGYGQNFINPHSLLSYFYYELKFSLVSLQLLSIKKKNIYQKVVPINIKSFIKNKNIFQKSNVFDNQNSTIKSDYVDENFYFYHRVVYRMTQDQLQYKIKNLYAYQLFTNNDNLYDKFAQKIGQKRYTEEEIDELKFQISKEYKNHLHVFKQNRNYIFSINYDLRVPQMNNGFENPYVKLTNQSIISIDYYSNFICALIKHEKYTKDKCVLAYEKIALPGNQALDRDQSLEIFLKHLKTFDLKLEIHALLISRKDEIVLIHGSCFQGFQVKDFIFKLKKQTSELFQQKSLTIQPKIISIKQCYSCTSFIFKKDHFVYSLNFMTFNQKKLNHVFAMDEYALNLADKNITWQETKPLIYFMLIWVEKEQQKIIRKQSLKFSELKRSQQTVCMIQSKDLGYTKKKVVFKVQDSFQQFVIVKSQNGTQYKVFKIYLLEAGKNWDVIPSCSRTEKSQSIYENNDIPRK